MAGSEAAKADSEAGAGDELECWCNWGRYRSDGVGSWEPECPAHGVRSGWWNSEEQRERRSVWRAQFGQLPTDSAGLEDDRAVWASNEEEF